MQAEFWPILKTRMPGDALAFVKKMSTRVSVPVWEDE